MTTSDTRAKVGQIAPTHLSPSRFVRGRLSEGWQSNLQITGTPLAGVRQGKGVSGGKAPLATPVEIDFLWQKS